MNDPFSRELRESARIEGTTKVGPTAILKRTARRSVPTYARGGTMLLGRPIGCLIPKPIAACSALRAQYAAIVFRVFGVFRGQSDRPEFRVFRVFRGHKVWKFEPTY
jgi:hypothetical protein